MTIDSDTNQRCQFWMTELTSGGNVKLISSDHSQPSFLSCSELVHSRFSMADVESLGISGLEVTEVIRVENRLLFNGYVKLIQKARLIHQGSLTTFKIQ